MPTPLLGLCLICKNESHGIAKTLETFKPYVDDWTILDTGSTDGTQDVIWRTLEGVPGRLFEEPFVDFSTSRNRALELHGQRTVFTVMPDSDDQLVGGEALHAFLLAHCDVEEQAHEAYNLNIRRGQLSYFLPLVMRTVAKWRYSGRVHECAGRPGCPPAQLSIAGVEVVQHREERSAAASKARWERDLVLLQADFDAKPDDPRTAFYLAQTLDCLGKTEEALAMYEKRIAIGGWIEETFEAKLRRTRMMQRLKRPWPEIQQAYLEAHVFAPGRAEPIYEIADYYYYQHDNLPLTYLFARRAAELPYPTNATLFVDHEVYAWKAAHLTAVAGYYLDAQAKVVGQQAVEQAIRARPDFELLRNNRVFYMQSAAEMFGASSQQLAFSPDAPFVAANPSIHFDGQTWRCLVRTLNYRIVKGWSYEPPDGVIQTNNVMLELGPPPSFEIFRVVPMCDLDPTPRTDYPVHGFEDCRLFQVMGRFYATATVCDFAFEPRGLREIVLLELNDEYAVERATPLRGVWSMHNQKNWMPVVNDALIVYGLQPTILLELDAKRAAKLRNAQQATVIQAGMPNMHLRGGSQLVPIAGGYLCLIHDVTWSNGYRTYLHRFVWLDKQFDVKKMSQLFFFQRRGIEYSCGLAYDEKNDLLVVSYSVEDSNANLATFAASKVLASLHEDFVV
jgi:tetratricopeptide (TPR) repeat protein